MATLPSSASLPKKDSTQASDPENEIRAKIKGGRKLQGKSSCANKGKSTVDTVVQEERKRLNILKKRKRTGDHEQFENETDSQEIVSDHFPAAAPRSRAQAMRKEKRGRGDGIPAAVRRAEQHPNTQTWEGYYRPVEDVLFSPPQQAPFRGHIDAAATSLNVAVQPLPPTTMSTSNLPPVANASNIPTPAPPTI
ncbi:MAG: hypothetical protein Q9218_007481 [Villophora microphyllina]